jgi:hypothetical protein
MFSPSPAPSAAFAAPTGSPVSPRFRMVRASAPALLHLSDSRKQRREPPSTDGVERVLARVLGEDPAYARKVARVRRYQRRLRGRLDVPSWHLYLQVEDAEIGRWTYALERVVDWLSGPGRRRR